MIRRQQRWQIDDDPFELQPGLREFLRRPFHQEPIGFIRYEVTFARRKQCQCKSTRPDLSLGLLSPIRLRFCRRSGSQFLTQCAAVSAAIDQNGSRAASRVFIGQACRNRRRPLSFATRDHADA
jgi:hypothetical protein